MPEETIRISPTDMLKLIRSALRDTDRTQVHDILLGMDKSSLITFLFAALNLEQIASNRALSLYTAARAAIDAIASYDHKGATTSLSDAIRADLRARSTGGTDTDG